MTVFADTGPRATLHLNGAWSPIVKIVAILAGVALVVGGVAIAVVIVDRAQHQELVDRYNAAVDAVRRDAIRIETIVSAIETTEATRSALADQFGPFLDRLDRITAPTGFLPGIESGPLASYVSAARAFSPAVQVAATEIDVGAISTIIPVAEDEVTEAAVFDAERAAARSEEIIAGAKGRRAEVESHILLLLDQFRMAYEGEGSPLRATISQIGAAVPAWTAQHSWADWGLREALREEASGLVRSTEGIVRMSVPQLVALADRMQRVIDLAAAVEASHYGTLSAEEARAAAEAEAERRALEELIPELPLFSDPFEDGPIH